MSAADWNVKGIRMIDSLPEKDLVLFRINGIYCAGIVSPDSIRYWRIFSVAKEARMWEFVRNALKLSIEEANGDVVYVKYKGERTRPARREGDYKELFPYYKEEITKKVSGEMLLDLSKRETTSEYVTEESIVFQDFRTPGNSYRYKCSRSVKFEDGRLQPLERQCTGKVVFPGGLMDVD